MFVPAATGSAAALGGYVVAAVHRALAEVTLTAHSKARNQFFAALLVAFRAFGGFCLGGGNDLFKFCFAVFAIIFIKRHTRFIVAQSKSVTP